MDPMLEGYLKRQRRRRRDPATLANCLRTLNRFQAFLDAQGLSAAQVGPEHLEQYLDGLLDEYSVSSSRLHLTYAKAVFKYAHDRGQIRVNPTYDLELPKEPDKAPRTFSIAELRRINDATRTPREELAHNLMAYSGVRINEARTLKWAAIDLDSRSMEIVGKYGKLRHVPIHPALAAVLIETPGRTSSTYLFENTDGRNLSRTSMHKMMKLLFERAKVEGTPHSYRKTVTTTMDECGVQTTVVDTIMGWAASTVRAKHYVRMATERQHQAILCLYPEPIAPERTPERTVSLSDQRNPNRALSQQVIPVSAPHLV